MTDLSQSPFGAYDPHELKTVMGGGGRPGHEGFTFVKAAIDISGASSTRVLVIPTAKTSQKSFLADYQSLADALGARSGGPNIKSLHDFDQRPASTLTRDQVLNEVDGATVVCFFGGDTVRLVKLMTDLHVDQDILASLCQPGRAGVGISAGFLCMCWRGQSDTQSYNVAPGEPWNYQDTPGWNGLPVYAIAHYNRFHPQTGMPRALDALERVARLRYGSVALAATNQAGWVFNAGDVNVVATEPTGEGFRLQPSASAPMGVASQAFAPQDGIVRLTKLIPPYLLSPLRPAGSAA